MCCFQEVYEGALKVYAMKLHPGMEIKSALIEFVKANNISSAFIITCCGSVRKCQIRYATCDGVEKGKDFNAVKVKISEILCRNFEITSLVGTLCKDGAHLHVTLGDNEGNTISGHVIGSLFVQTTAEIVLGTACGINFSRQYDESTGFNELVVSKSPET
ncbi:hypothetical protein L9F63_014243 [Diploptera punctata]|uniref:PPC domain-containing protein n=1 Tax=Diploptera punctata TaxID=6984 RepID=A0AAD8ELA1_DIPPU|nr:hypothetical protein L9F63_014243 [Diploptera punctata]